MTPRTNEFLHFLFILISWCQVSTHSESTVEKRLPMCMVSCLAIFSLSRLLHVLSSFWCFTFRLALAVLSPVHILCCVACGMSLDQIGYNCVDFIPSSLVGHGSHLISALGRDDGIALCTRGTITVIPSSVVKTSIHSCTRIRINSPSTEKGCINKLRNLKGITVLTDYSTAHIFESIWGESR